MSYCKSSECHYQPCSQSQRMSIGIVAEKDASKGPHLIMDHNVKQGVKASATLNKCEDDAQDGFVRTTAGSLAANMMINDSLHTEKHESRLAISSSSRGMGQTHTVHFFGNQTMSQTGVGKQIDTDSLSGQECKRAGTDGRSEAITCALRQQVCKSVKEVLQEQPSNTENRSKETLKMKLREVLGMNACANEKFGSSRIFEVGGNEMTQKQTLEGDSHFKRRQNSDTIETDSENADVMTKRPVTRSFSRKRAAGSTQPRNLKPKSFSCGKEEKQGINIFSFAKKSVFSQSCAENHGCLMTERNDSAKRSCGIKSGDMLNVDLKNMAAVIIGGEKPPPVEESHLHIVTTSPPHGCQNKNVQPGAPVQNVNSPVIKDTHQLQDAGKPVPLQKSKHHESFCAESPAPHYDDLYYPVLKMTKTAVNSPLGLLPLNKDKVQHVDGSTQAAEWFNIEDKCLNKSSPATEEDNSDSSDYSATPEGTHVSAEDSSREDKDVEIGLFTPVRAESDSTEEVSSPKKVYSKDIDMSSEIGLLEKPMFFRNKRHCSHGVDYDDFCPSATPKVGGSTDDVLMKFSERSPEDGFIRVVSLIGLALKKLKSKMMLATNERCSDILMSAAEEIHSQLQNVESQIQTDLGNLTSLKTSKRKHLETWFQEQQEHLKVTHEKFKEEIHKYIQDCRGAMEGLETQHVELKGAIEKQKALHRKLLLQAEAAVETHLIDARKHIVSVRQVGKQKMQLLKVAVAECLKDEISG